MKCGISYCRGQLLLTLLLGVALAGPAVGDTIFFDGPDGLGTGAPLPAEFDPDFVLSALIFPILSGELEFLTVGTQSADEMPFAGGPPSEITSEWVVNQGDDFGALAEGDFFLVFATALNRDVLSSDDVTVLGTTAYSAGDTPGARAGLMIDPVDGWVLVETQAMIGGVMQTLYYPGISLEFLTGDEQDQCGTETISAGQTCVDIRYFLENPDVALFTETDGTTEVLGLPELPIMMAYIPEPGTGALLTLGLVALAANRRLRA